VLLKAFKSTLKGLLKVFKMYQDSNSKGYVWPVNERELVRTSMEKHFPTACAHLYCSCMPWNIVIFHMAEYPANIYICNCIFVFFEGWIHFVFRTHETHLGFCKDALIFALLGEPQKEVREATRWEKNTKV
jgi:hypothetical protein